MTAKLLDLGKPQHQTIDDLNGLRSYLSQLLGEQFDFARISYGDELTLHFGQLRPAASPKLREKPYGAFILGTRGSPWKLSLGATAAELRGGRDFEPDDVTTVLSSQDVENNEYILPGSLVVDVKPFIDRTTERFGLQITLSDASRLLVLPINSLESSNDAEDEAEELPELADWELLTPRGVLSAGPGRKWSFEPLAT